MSHVKIGERADPACSLPTPNPARAKAQEKETNAEPLAS